MNKTIIMGNIFPENIFIGIWEKEIIPEQFTFANIIVIIKDCLSEFV